MPDPVDDRLSAFGDGPLPPLAAGATVRARGERRRLRARIALATAAVLGAAGLGGTVALLSGPGGADALQFAGDPSPSVSPTPSGCNDAYCSSLEIAPAPDEQSCLVPAGPDEDLCPPVMKGPPPPPPPPAPTPTPTATPMPEPRAWQVGGAFLSPEQASTAEMPGWAVDGEHEPGAGPLLDPCQQGRHPGPFETSQERAMASVREAGGSRLVQEVFRYPSAQDASAAFEEYAAQVERCPSAPAVEGPEGYTSRFTAVDRSAEQGGQQLLVQVQPCDDQGACTAHFRTYLFVAQATDGLTAVAYGIGEDGDPVEDASALLDAAAKALSAAVSSR